MLVQLVIHQYATIEHLDLELSSGMTVITGETGAGKSIMVDALGLALGDRADSAAVRPGAERADILACFDLEDLPEARQWLQEHDLQQEDGLCILRRVISAEGRSKAYINGTPCPQTDLRSLGERMIDIHSQHEHQSLLKPETQRRLLDEYANAQTLAQELKSLADRWQETQNALKHLQQQAADREARLELTRYQHEELEQLNLQEGEVETLEQEQQHMAQAEHMMSLCTLILGLCSDNETGSIRTALSTCLSRLNSLTLKPKALEEAFNLLSNAQIQVDEASREIQHFMEHFNLDPEHQQRVENRLNSLYTLARKHRIQPSALGALQQQLAEQLTQADQQEEHLDSLKTQREQLHTQYRALAQKLTLLRQQAAPKLAEAVEQEIRRLGMPHGQLAIQLTPIDSQQPQGHGQEHISFQVSANPGQPLRPLNKVASGGELSRISLAIQVITARTSHIPTLVFDEVDVGIGGPTAEVVGQLLRQLGQQGQVLSVTHQPQVAAQGHQHLFVCKASDGQSTHSQVRQLDTTERLQEVARMLGGTHLGDTSLAHAQALLESVRDKA